MKSLCRLSLFLAGVSTICASAADLKGQPLGTEWTKDPLNPLFAGVPSGWNKHVADPMVLYNADSARFEMWYLGQTSSEQYQIGFAVSADGVNWSTSDTLPVLARVPGTWETDVFSPMVMRDQGSYRMWYTGYDAAMDRVSIGYATSPDGRNWTRHPGNPILRPRAHAWDAGGPARPSIIYENGQYQMWYEGADSTWAHVNIGRAVSTDGITWERDPVDYPALERGAVGEWDHEAITVPRVISIQGDLLLFYTGFPTGTEIRRIGLATFVQGGFDWERSSANPVLTPGPSGTWDGRSVQIGSVLQIGQTLHMWYGGRQEYSSLYLWKIGHATSLITGVGGEVSEVPDAFELEQNYPNPFNPSTTIRYGLPRRSHVTLTVFNTLGQQVATLVEGEMEAGYHEVKFDASRLPSGVYLYRLQAGNHIEVKRGLLMK